MTRKEIIYITIVLTFAIFSFLAMEYAYPEDYFFMVAKQNKNPIYNEKEEIVDYDIKIGDIIRVVPCKEKHPDHYFKSANWAMLQTSMSKLEKEAKYDSLVVHNEDGKPVEQCKYTIDLQGIEIDSKTGYATLEYNVLESKMTEKATPTPTITETPKPTDTPKDMDNDK